MCRVSSLGSTRSARQLGGLRDDEAVEPLTKRSHAAERPLTVDTTIRRLQDER